MRKKDKPATTPTVSQVIAKQLATESVGLCNRYRELKEISPNNTAELVELEKRIWALWRRVDDSHRPRGFGSRSNRDVVKSVVGTICAGRRPSKAFKAFRKEVENLIIAVVQN